MGAKENAKKRFEELDQPKRRRGTITVPWRGMDLCRVNPFFCNTIPNVSDTSPQPTPTPSQRGRHAG